MANDGKNWSVWDRTNGMWMTPGMSESDAKTCAATWNANNKTIDYMARDRCAANSGVREGARTT